MSTTDEAKSWLTPSERRRLGIALAALLPLGRTYLVGSALAPPDQARCRATSTCECCSTTTSTPRSTASSGRRSPTTSADRSEASTGVARIDFQIQSVTEANTDHDGPRSALFAWEAS